MINLLRKKFTVAAITYMQLFKRYIHLHTYHIANTRPPCPLPAVMKLWPTKGRGNVSGATHRAIELHVAAKNTQ